jgi:hypothetical protein
MPLTLRGTRSVLRSGIAACLAATTIALCVAGPVAASVVPAAAAARPDRPVHPPLPPTAAVPAGDATGRKIG